MYFGVIDIGSTTLRLSLYKYENAALSQIYNKKIFTRLSEEVEHNCLNADGMDAITQGIKQYMEEMAEIPSVKVFCFAGAFIRELDNYKAIVDELYNRLVLKVEVLSAAEEAKYALNGFLRNEKINSKKGLLIGVGGTSTLLVYYENGTLVNYESLELGSIRELKPLIDGIVPTTKEIAAINKAVQAKLKTLPWLSKVKVDTVYSVSGNGRAIARIHKDLHKTKGNTNAYAIPAAEVHEIVKILSGMQQDAVLYLNEVVPGRIHSFMPSAIILSCIMEEVEAQEFRTAHYGLREGFLLHHNLNGKE